MEAVAPSLQRDSSATETDSTGNLSGVVCSHSGDGGIDRKSPHMAVKVGAHIEDPRHLFTAIGARGHWQCPAMLGGQEGNHARQSL